MSWLDRVAWSLDNHPVAPHTVTVITRSQAHTHTHIEKLSQHYIVCTHVCVCFAVIFMFKIQCFVRRCIYIFRHYACFPQCFINGDTGTTILSHRVYNLCKDICVYQPFKKITIPLFSLVKDVYWIITL